MLKCLKKKQLLQYKGYCPVSEVFLIYDVPGKACWLKNNSLALIEVVQGSNTGLDTPCSDRGRLWDGFKVMPLPLPSSL
jgi:hypothetical protein